MAWMETDYSKDVHSRWKIKWQLGHLGMLRIMGETAPLNFVACKGEGHYIVIACVNNIVYPDFVQF